jgi:Fic-DOC domain mobile mystery protein B
VSFVEPEGATPLDPDEREGLRFRHVTTREQLNELEQANMEQGLAWIARRRGDIFDDAFARDLHWRLFGDVWDWAGKYRMTEKNIGIDPVQIPMQLRALLDGARYWVVHGIFSPLEAAARFHHRMVQIHLFANGNGRHARIAADIMLEDHYDHPPVAWAGGYDIQADNQRRAHYISSLRAADAGDFGPLLAFVVS